MAKRGPRPKGRVDTTWRPELAYAVGLITADGSLSINGRHINFTSKDIDLIHTFQKCLHLEDIKIGKKSRGREQEKKYYQVQFGDVLFYKWLEDCGLTPHKSLTIQSVEIPPTYFFDFVRGVWDGDGTITYSKDTRWKNSYMVSIGFTSGSKDFLFWLQREINKRLATTGSVTKSTRVLQLRYAKKDSHQLFDAMFYTDSLPSLERKFAKAQKIFKMNGL